MKNYTHEEYEAKLAQLITAEKEIAAIEAAGEDDEWTRDEICESLGHNSFADLVSYYRPVGYQTKAGRAITITAAEYKAGKKDGFTFSKISLAKNYCNYIAVQLDSPMHAAIIGDGLTVETENGVVVFKTTEIGDKYNDNGTTMVRAYLPRTEEQEKKYQFQQNLRKAEEQQAQAVSAMLDLPSLKGSPKQIAWAEKIRAKVAASNDTEAKKSLKKEKTAKFWIENFRNF